MLTRLIFGVGSFLCVMAGTAVAGEERSCSAQYSLEEQFTLEWAAIGGDPHAQFAITQCAFPDNRGDLTTVEKVYALKWLTLASCDFYDTDALIRRDKVTRALKEQGDISFRRFGGLSEDEKLNRRERRFVEYREHRLDKMRERFDALKAETSEAEKDEARAALAEQFSRMGALGLLRLANLTSCSHYGASDAFAAAAWSATDEVWRSSAMSDVYGEPDHSAWEISNEAETRIAGLTLEEKRVFDIEKRKLLRTEPATLVALEERAALANMQNFSMVHSAAGLAGTGFTDAPTFSLTTAVQYALEAMGFVEFVNGPDNDYGPSTIEAARKAQAHYGYEETRWLSHAEIRRTICDAAVRQSDPVSFFHLGVMFANGWGFRQDLDRARFAMSRAETILASKLRDPDNLEDWKLREYPAFMPRIKEARASLETTWAALPSHTRSDQSLVNAANLCE